MKKILVIDGNSIINRAFYGIRPLTTKSGKFTNAIYGMVNIITKQLDAIKPDFCAVAFDLKHPTFRHNMYPGYKQGRHPTPEELLSQFPDAKECLTLMGIKVLELPGWEADDIQGTIAKMAWKEKDTESYVLSGDRDLLQLIDEKVTVLLATNSDTISMKEEQFKEKYGIIPSQFVDMKALMGDSSDNIPGVAGIGEKTAGALIQAFSSLEGIYENIDDARIKPGAKAKLLADRENAYLSRTLARIDINAPLDVELSDIEYKGFDKKGLYKKFSELELNSLIAKFSLTASDESSVESGILTFLDCEYKEKSKEELEDYKFDICSVETSDNSVYISINGENVKYCGHIKDISHIFENKSIICYDGKALWHSLDVGGANLDKTQFFDIMMYEYVLNPGNGCVGLNSLVSIYLGKTVKCDTSPIFLSSELEKVMREKVLDDGLEAILFELEIPLINVLAKIEKTGFMINAKGILEFRGALEELADDLANRIYMQAGEVFNINSPKQLGEVLYERLGLCAGKKSKTGYHTDAATLEEMRHLNPIIDDILEYRQVTKLLGTYTTALTDVADDEGRIHTDFKQALTATGRLSSADPNLQNIPIRTKMGRELRRFFISREGYTLLDADYSQIELRLLSHISGDENMRSAFINNLDIHRSTAAAVFGVEEEEVTDDMRKKAKAVNFGIVYGISGFSLSKDIGTGVQEAARYIKSYLESYPLVDEYLKAVVKNAELMGYTRTPMGRRRYIPELKAPKAQLKAFGKRIAMNAPIQGAAADIMKLAMIKVDRALGDSGLDAKIVMQVHDELILEVKDEDVKRCAEILKCEMENAVTLSIPLTTDVTAGKNWLEQKEI